MSCPAWCKEPGCTLAYGAHPWGFGVHSSALPTRAKSDTVATNRREARWQKDMPAYKELRGQGVQPKGIDGCHELAARASDRLEVESGQLLSRGQRKTAKSVLEDLAV